MRERIIYNRIKQAFNEKFKTEGDSYGGSVLGAKLTNRLAKVISTPLLKIVS
jgi:hypothetical protein